MKYLKRLYKYELLDDFIAQIPVTPGQVIEHEYYYLNTIGLLHIRRGYMWDGPSGPTYDSKGLMIGSLVHDVGYQMTRDGWFDIDQDRALWDQVYFDLIKRNGINPIRAWGHYRMLRRFGWKAALPDKDHIYEV